MVNIMCVHLLEEEKTVKGFLTDEFQQKRSLCLNFYLSCNI